MTSVTLRSKVESPTVKSPASQLAYIRRKVSTFSCDIAYSESPAASRASCLS